MKRQSETFSVFIDNKECLATKGESLLNVARNNGINIPTLCDLKKLSPTGACRMCVVEQDGNIVASCKSFLVKPIRVYTDTPRLQKYRNQIMSFLCINHPLECGVCDKSGECELQDKVLESKVAIQPYFAVQKKNDFVHFHNKIYDESLCIVCERCARTCNEFVGNNVLSVLAGGFSSKIGVNFQAYCEDCDECVSVCPTGAMISSRFVYSSNAWELEKTQSHCVHCPLHCELEYEVKHNIDSKKEVYRIKNKAHIHQLCHAGRHNFMRTNPFSESFIKDSKAEQNTLLQHFNLQKILDDINAIRLGIDCTNEEAYLANLLALQNNKKLYCDEALRYSEFGSLLGKKEILPVNELLENVDSCIVLGSYMYDEIPVLRSDLSKHAIKRGMKNAWIHPISETRFKSDLELKYEVGAELGVAILLLHACREKILAMQSSASQEILDWLDTLDLGNIGAESNVSEYELEYLKQLCLQSYPVITPNHEEVMQHSKLVILVGADFYLSPEYNLIAQILRVINELDMVDVVPLAYGNANGIQAICNLTHDNGNIERSLGIRCNAEYTIAPVPYSSGKQEKHCPILPLQFIEGSVIDSNCRLTKLYPSFVDDGFIGLGSFSQNVAVGNPNLDLLDIVKDCLRCDFEYLIDFTSKLPFNKLAFDSLQQKQSIALCFNAKLLPIALPHTVCIHEGSGIFMYRGALSGNLSFYSRANCEEYYKESCQNAIISHGVLKVSNQFCIATNLQDNEVISLQIANQVIDVRIEAVSTLKGMVAVLLSDVVIDSKKYFDYKRLRV